MRLFFLGLLLALVAWFTHTSAPAADNPKPSPKKPIEQKLPADVKMGADLRKTASEFVKAYHAKNTDELMKLVDAPFLVGPLKGARRIEKEADLLAEFKSRFSNPQAVDKFPSKVMKVHLWNDKGLDSPGPDKDFARKGFKEAIEHTGEKGALAILGWPTANKNVVEIGGAQLYLTIKNGKAKVVGIREDK